ncbi:uncharacterized protein STEHIDRAFT_124908 [Stereum hirsutum FP-91666 SS1]|uniref:uncharacterized protein n=1 Tax=Stereum hirsutum (strain FP-91666) TaxID=721885 RepID=UPI000444A36C|nr:uncharacterized protein STEHIDRAFT_124908 [Stereum hirsutum FP-91666 SS1]EIM82105.1 hypothetical protein STEHIDRAFT_124908 [Stereum hirsutum FP-91666 SS1]
MANGKERSSPEKSPPSPFFHPSGLQTEHFRRSPPYLEGSLSESPKNSVARKVDG